MHARSAPMAPGAWALAVAAPLGEDVRRHGALSREAARRARDCAMLARLTSDPTAAHRLAVEAVGWLGELADHLRAVRLLTAYLEGMAAMADQLGGRRVEENDGDS